MKNREIIMRRLERAESNMEKLNFLLSRQGTREQFNDVIQETREVIQDAKSFVQQEPMSQGEVNPF
jgi:ElaB/YqjD/DUF883 family membrane-anchored ribosome-binding protein